VNWLKRFWTWLKPNTVKVGGGISDTPNGTAREVKAEAEWRLK
jgi:hypothetical protein